MSITSGFFNSKNHDRRYNATQMGMIFDGVIQDGVYRTIGTRFETLANGTDMLLTIGIGRAWFDHTWTYNDAPLPLEVPEAELILKRIDAVVLDVDNTTPTRKNDIFIVKGTPASNPSPPTMIKSEKHNQYPLAYVAVDPNVTSIRQADVTNLVGQEPTPYVISPLEKLDITEQVKRWEDQWDQFYELETSDMENTSDYWKESWNEWYDNYTDTNTADIVQWKTELDTQIKAWLDSIQVLIDEDTATNLANAIVKINSQMDYLMTFREELMTDRAIYDPLEDSDGNPILDNNNDKILGDVKFEKAGRSEELIRAFSKDFGTPLTMGDVVPVIEKSFAESIKVYTNSMARNKDVPLSLRRNIYGGEHNLGYSYTSEQKKAVYNGTFDGLAIGDYWLNDDVAFMIADMDYFPQLLAQGIHHLVIVPDKIVGTSTFVATNNGAVSYSMDDCIILNVTPAAGIENRTNSIFGSSLKQNIAFYNYTGWVMSDIAPDNGTTLPTHYVVEKKPAYAPITKNIAMLTTTAVFGDSLGVYNSRQGPFHKQLAMFNLRPERICSNGNYWLGNLDTYLGDAFNVIAAYCVTADGQLSLDWSLRSVVNGIRFATIIKGAAS